MAIKRYLLALKRRIQSIPSYLAWIIPSEFSRNNKKKLLRYRNLHKGKRCFVIANGPSLKDMDLSLLENEVTIGMNRIYLMAKVNNFKPTYLLCTDLPVQLSQFTKEYNDYPGEKLFDWKSRKLFARKDNLTFFSTRFSRYFGGDFIKDRVGNSKSVTYTCLQFAYYLGCTEVILIGKDHSYNTGGADSSSRLIESNGLETNHFIDGYYKKGMVWGNPNYEIEELTYRLAKEAFEEDGRRVVDATVGGKLQVFDKVNYKDLF